MERTPMPQELGAPPEAVRAHGAALRALARALLGDSAAADDAVQDTWVRYLERPPSAGAGVGGWLATVLRNLVSNRRREEARRSERERVAARSEHVDAHDLSEREEALRVVVEAVLTLEPQYRAVVMLRWFDGLAPREVAAQLGLAPSVVHTRLARAHAQLRAKLEREHGSRRAHAFLFGLAGLRVAPRPWTWTVGAGVALMTSKLLVGSSVAVAVLAAWLWFGARTPADEALATAQRDVTTASVAQTAPHDDAAVDAPERSAIPELVAPTATEDARAAWDAPRFEYTLEVRVVDALDSPFGRQTLYAAPAGVTLNDVGATDETGRALLRWRGFQPAMELDLALDPSRDVRRIRVEAGEQLAHLRSHERAPMRMSSVQVSTKFTLSVPGSAPSVKVLSELPLAALGEWSGATAERDAEGRLLFVEPALVRAPATQVESLVLDEDVRLAQAALKVEGRALSLGERRTNSEGATIEGVLRDAEQKPVVGATVYAWREGARRQGARTNADGAFAIDRLAAGDWQVFAGGGDHGRAQALLSVGASGAVVWNAQLERGLELRAKLLDANKAPLAGWTIEAHDEDVRAPWSDVATSGADGSFVIPNLPARPLRLFALRPEAPFGAAVRVEQLVSPGSAVLEIEVDTEADRKLGALAFELASSSDQAPDLLWVRAWNESSNRAVEGRIVDGDGDGRQTSVHIGDLETGWQRVEIALAGRELLVLPRVFLAPGETLNLGPQFATSAAHLELPPGGDKLAALTVVWRGETVELRQTLEAPGVAALELRPGEFQLTLRTAATSSQRTLSAAAGGTLTLD
jgi:RNA polymerase sigma-70 factor (ECF subfamily)